METFEGIGGIEIMSERKHDIDLLEARDIFIRKFCEDKGWNCESLSIQQILEIRKQDGWKNPTINNS